MYPFGGHGRKTVDDSFADYSRAASNIQPGNLVPPLVYGTEPDPGRFRPGGRNAPFFGTIGLVSANNGVAAPLGPWHPVYDGIVPNSVQPKIIDPEPWQDPKLR